jgi:hypothetical protein
MMPAIAIPDSSSAGCSVIERGGVEKRKREREDETKRCDPSI